MQYANRDVHESLPVHASEPDRQLRGCELLLDITNYNHSKATGTNQGFEFSFAIDGETEVVWRKGSVICYDNDHEASTVLAMANSPGMRFTRQK